MRIILFHEIANRDCARVRKAVVGDTLRAKGHTVSFSNVAFPENLAVLHSVAGQDAQVPVLVVSSDGAPLVDEKSTESASTIVITEVEAILAKLEELSR